MNVQVIERNNLEIAVIDTGNITLNIYADEAQQMVARQGFRVAVVGSFVGLGANTLRIFDYERNPDSAIFLAKSEEEAIERLSS